MNFMDQLDPELRVVLEAFPTDKAVNLHDIPAARAKMRKLFTSLQATLPAVEGVTSRDHSVPGRQGAPAVREAITGFFPAIKGINIVQHIVEGDGALRCSISLPRSGRSNSLTAFT